MFNITQVCLILILLSVANGTPVILARILGNNLAQPLDGGCKFFDGQPLFRLIKNDKRSCISTIGDHIGFPLNRDFIIYRFGSG